MHFMVVETHPIDLILPSLLRRTLTRTITELDVTQLAPFPPFDGHRFRDIMDKEMGFI
jgi:hypothetical protein